MFREGFKVLIIETREYESHANKIMPMIFYQFLHLHWRLEMICMLIKNYLTQIMRSLGNINLPTDMDACDIKHPHGVVAYFSARIEFSDILDISAWVGNIILWKNGV